jgi:hypothetical protein
MTTKEPAITRIGLAHLTSGAAICTVLVISGCGGSSGGTTAPPPGTPFASAPAAASSAPSASTAPQASTALSGLLGSGGPLDVSKLCAAVPQADVQKLFKATAPTFAAYPGECNWGNGAITVDIFFNDGNKKLYSGGGVSTATAKMLPGVGDLAQWAQPVPGQTVPFVVAHKGTTSISVSPGLDVDQTTMSYTGSSPFFKVSNASAEQYAAAEGQICNDLFAAAKS